MYSEKTRPINKFLTTREAEEILAKNNFPGQRAYNPAKGKLYADNMKQGSHRRIEVALATVRDTGEEYLMNGQHNCNALIQFGRPYPATIQHYDCETMTDAWRLFATFDGHASRTEGQFIRGRRGLFSDARLHEIPMLTMAACGTALYAINSGPKVCFHRLVQPSSKTVKADLIEKHSRDVVFASKWAKYHHLNRVGVMAAIILTGRINEAKAIEFWDSVATGELLVLNDPRRKLRDELLESRQRSRLSSSGGKENQQTQFLLCVHWWNAWRTGANRTLVRITDLNVVPEIKA